MPIYRFDGVLDPAENDQFIETEDINGFRRLVSIGGTIELSTVQVANLRQRFDMALSTDPVPSANRSLVIVDQQYLEERIEGINAEYDKTIDRQHGDVDHVAAADPHYDRAYARSLILTESVRRVGSTNQPAFNADFVNAGSGTQDLFFYLDASGIVHIEGTIKSPAGQAAGVPIFRLPSPLTNIILNSRFDTVFSPWTASLGSTVRSTDWGKSGIASAHSTGSGLSQGSYNYQDISGASVIPGEFYSAAVEINRITAVDGPLFIRLVLLAIGGPGNGTILAGYAQNALAGQFRLVASAVAALPSGATAIRCAVDNANFNVTAKAIDYYWTDVVVSKSLEPPPYQILAQHLPSGKVRGGSASTGSGNSVQLEVATNGDVSMTAAAVANSVYGINMSFRGV